MARGAGWIIVLTLRSDRTVSVPAQVGQRQYVLRPLSARRRDDWGDCVALAYCRYAAVRTCALSIFQRPQLPASSSLLGSLAVADPVW